MPVIVIDEDGVAAVSFCQVGPRFDASMTNLSERRRWSAPNAEEAEHGCDVRDLRRLDQEGVILNPMHALKAQVKNGRLVLDEPTDLAEGREVELFVLDDEEFAPEEKARLLQAIEDGVEDFERGDHMDGFEFIAQLRAK